MTINTSPWQTLFINVNLATMTDGANSYGAIENGALAIIDGKIVWLGKESDLPTYNPETVNVIDGLGKWLTPGLVDCHTHLVYGGNRANEFEMRLEGKSYQEIAEAGGGIISTVKATREATEGELLASALPRLTSLHQQGVTTVEIKSGYGLDTESEIKMLKVAKLLGEHHKVDVKTTFLGAHALPPEYKTTPPEQGADAYIDLVCEKMMPKVAELGLADAVDAFCEGVGFSNAQTRKVFEKAKELGLPVKLHAEQLSNLKGAELVAEFNGLSADHIEFLDDNEEVIDELPEWALQAVETLEATASNDSEEIVSLLEKHDNDVNEILNDYDNFISNI